MNKKSKSPNIDLYYQKTKFFLLKALQKIKKLMISDKEDSISPLKQSLFIGLSLFTIIVCGPLLIYGSFMFFREGRIVLAASEVFALLLLILLVLQKKISIENRKFLIVLLLYSFSIVLLISTANYGAGMVCIVAIMFLSGIVLETKKLLLFLLINIVVFTGITILLLSGVFDGSVMESYKNIWFINMLTAQASGIGLMFLIHLIYKALDKRNKEIKKSETLLQESEKSKALILAHLKGMVYRCRYDRSWTMEYVSEGCFELTGYKPDSLLGNKDLSYNELIDPEYRNLVWNDWTDALINNAVYKGEYFINTAKGEKKWVYEQGNGVYDNDGGVAAIEGIIIDITEHKNKEDKILYLNQYDVLTGVYNRRWFEENRDKVLIEKNNPISVIVGDINGLKLINDALGHQAGDRHIKEAASIIKKCCRQNDIVARTGGDEFIVIMPNTEAKEAAEVLSRIQLKCKVQNEHIAEEQYYLSLSLGYATKREEQESIDDVIKIAEDYMYRRKLLENNSIHSSLISSIQTTMNEKSHETEAHSVRLAVLAEKIGEKLNLAPNELDELELLAMLHDIGKIGIDDSIINKPGKLTDAEWEQMKRHPEIGYRIAISSPDLAPIADYILSHHERWDGKGYPRGLEGEAIPIHARIIAVADAYDAMTYDRPYRKALAKEIAIAEIKNNAGKQFDPRVVQVFIDIITNNKNCYILKQL